MLYVFPDYYKEFKCISSECRHNCCIGWEIDIDPDTDEFYRSVDGELGECLKNSISRDGEPHFILGEGERCPFLRDDNLCRIICELGEDSLCSICADHPRFRCELPGRIETGLGLCCEAAGRLILGKKEKTYLTYSGEGESEDEIIELRDKVTELLQSRERSIDGRVSEMLSLCGSNMPEMSFKEWAEFLLSLERLDEEWTKYLLLLGNRGDEADTSAFDEYMADRQTEYEQLLVYLVYRHFANSPDYESAAARAAFAALGYELIHILGALIYEEKDEFTIEDQVELCRLFSSEIEYSDENLYEIIDLMYD